MTLEISNDKMKLRMVDPEEENIFTQSVNEADIEPPREFLRPVSLCHAALHGFVWLFNLIVVHFFNLSL